MITSGALLFHPSLLSFFELHPSLPEDPYRENPCMLNCEGWFADVTQFRDVASLPYLYRYIMLSLALCYIIFFVRCIVIVHLEHYDLQKMHRLINP